MKKILFYIFFFGFGFCAFSQLGESAETLGKIEQLIASGKYDDGKKILMNVSVNKIQKSGKHFQAHYYFLKATVANNSEDYKEAEKYLNSLLKNYKDVLEKDKKLLGKTYFELAYSASGNYNQKYEIYYTQKALKVMETYPTLFSQREIISAYNNLYYYQNNYDDAEGIYQTYLKFQNYFRKLSGKSEEYPYARRVFRKMETTVAVRNNQPEKAKQILEDFKKECNPNPTDNDIAYINSCYSEIADYYYYYKEDYKEAIIFSRDYIDYAKKTKSPFNQMLAYSKTGSSYLKLKDYENALKELDLSVESYEWNGFSPSFSALQTLRAICFSELKKYDKASKIAEKTIKDIVEYKTEKPEEIFTMDYNNFRELNSHYFINIFASCGHIFLKKYKSEHQKKDLEKAEKLFAISSQMFREFYLKGEFNPLLHHLHTKIMEGLLNAAYEKYARNIQKTSEIIGIIEGNSSKHLYKEFLKKRNLADSGSFSGMSNNDKNFIQNIQKNLKPNEQIIKFYVGSDDIFQVLITKNNIELLKSGATEKIRNLTTDFVGKIKTPAVFPQPSEALRKILLPKISGKKIILISDDFLNYLPFESLTQNGKYLVEHFDFSYHYSLALWKINQSENRKSKNKISVFAPAYKENSTFNGVATPPLPFARKEAKEILQLFSGGLFSHQNATKNHFYNQSKTSDILHLSMHSILDEDNFKKSCLLFQNSEPLFFEELYQRKIPVEMTVLGACNTGNGQLKNGEGIMSISHAFTFAGSRSNVYSLWEIPDKETAELMGYFYRFLKKGQQKDEALANAKREFVKNNPLKTHPYFWAGFIVNGNTNPITESNKLWILWVVLGIIVFGSFWFLKKKLR